MQRPLVKPWQFLTVCVVPVVVGPSSRQHRRIGKRRNITYGIVGLRDCLTLRDRVCTVPGILVRNCNVLVDGSLHLLECVQLFELSNIKFSMDTARLILVIGNVKAFGL